MVLHDVKGCYTVLHGFFRVLHGVDGYYTVVHGVTRCYRVNETETHKTDRNPPITNHKPLPFDVS